MVENPVTSDQIALRAKVAFVYADAQHTQRPRNVEKINPLRAAITEINDTCGTDVAMGPLEGNIFVYMDVGVEENEFRIGFDSNGNYEVRVNNGEVSEDNPPDYLACTRDINRALEAIQNILAATYPDHAVGISNIVKKYCSPLGEARKVESFARTSNPV